jgi:hypothetical protein
MVRAFGRRVVVLAGVAGLAMTAGCSPAASNGTASAATGLGALLQPVSTAGAAGMTTFTDPTQNAFTISVPQGWTVKGGIQGAAGSAQPWITAISPDGATSIMIGDPSVPIFTLPSPAHPAGSTVQIVGGVASPVEPYENAVQFAADYAQRAYGSNCAGMTPAASQAEPALTQIAVTQVQTATAAIGGPPLSPDSFNGGSATFTCHAGGAADVVGVLDVTYDFPLNPGGIWKVPLIASYRTPAASQAQTDQFVRAMRQSYQVNAQWQAQQFAAGRRQMAALKQQGQQQMAAMQQVWQAGDAAMNAELSQSRASLNAAHAATMAQLNAQGAQNARNFAAQQYNTDTNTQAEIRNINNQTCVQWADAAHTRCAVTAPN